MAIMKDKCGDMQAKMKKDDGYLYFTPLDLFPISPTKENVFNYIVSSKWVSTKLSKILAKRPDERKYIVELYHEILLAIYDKLDNAIALYENRGIKPFIAYVQTIIDIQGTQSSSVCHRNCKGMRDVTLCGDNFRSIEDKWSGEGLYKFE